MEWVGTAQVQIGAYDAPPPARTAPFLAGFVAGLRSHAAVSEAALSDVDPFSPAHFTNPTRHVRFRFRAESQDAAERLAGGELRDAALQAGVDAVDPGLREFGWTISVSVDPA